MPRAAALPLIGIPVNFVSDEDPERSSQHTAASKYPAKTRDVVGGTPVLIPALPDAEMIAHYLEILDGLLLTGGRANIEPHHYGGPPFPEGEITDPARDNTVLPLIRGCVENNIPVLGICRGIQEINVALGGTLHYRVNELPGKMDHRMRQDVDTRDERFALRHRVTLTEGGLFHKLAGKTEIMVNSLHGQGIDRLAPGAAIEAVSEDGVIEGIRVGNDDSFVVGVQWHAEYHPDHHELSHELFKSFGEAARRTKTAREEGNG